jgi:hypothetical protein
MQGGKCLLLQPSTMHTMPNLVDLQIGILSALDPAAAAGGWLLSPALAATFAESSSSSLMVGFCDLTRAEAASTTA